LRINIYFELYCVQVLYNSVLLPTFLNSVEQMQYSSVIRFNKNVRKIISKSKSYFYLTQQFYAGLLSVFKSAELNTSWR